MTAQLDRYGILLRQCLPACGRYLLKAIYKEVLLLPLYEMVIRKAFFEVSLVQYRTEGLLQPTERTK